MKYTAFENLNTPRLLLRKFTMEDVTAYYQRLAGSEEVTKYMFFRPHRDISETVQSLEKLMRRYEEGNIYRWAITLQEDGSLIGAIDLLRFEEAEGTCSFAYMLAREFWGRGYGTEALKAVLDFAFKHMDMQRVEAEHFSENAASGAVMRKAGMEYLYTEPEKYEKNGIKYDAPQYAITRDMWMAGAH